MPSTRSLPRAVLFGTALIVWCAALAAAPAGRDDALKKLHASIETAFAHCDPAPLQAAFSPRLKTYLSSPALDVAAGYYGADQVLLILRRWLTGRTTLRFHLGELEKTDQERGRQVIRARWQHRAEGSSRSEVRLSFTLAPEGPAWFIREIRELK